MEIKFKQRTKGSMGHENLMLHSMRSEWKKIFNAHMLANFSMDERLVGEPSCGQKNTDVVNHTTPPSPNCHDRLCSLSNVMCDWVRGVIIDCIHLVNIKCRLYCWGPGCIMHRKNFRSSCIVVRHFSCFNSLTCGTPHSSRSPRCSFNFLRHSFPP